MDDGRYLQTYKRDVSLVDLLSDVADFDVMEALKPIPLNVNILMCDVLLNGDSAETQRLLSDKREKRLAKKARLAAV